MALFTIAAVLTTFTGVLLVVLGAYWLLVLRPEARVHRSLEQRMRPPDPVRTKRIAVPVSELRRRSAPAMFKGIQRTIDQSGLRLTVPSLLFLCWMTGFLIALLVWTATRALALPLITGASTSAVPYLIVRLAANRRMWKFEEQFPEAIDLIARALRAGHALPTGLAMVADEIGAPVGPEFKRLYDRQNFGMQLPDALRAFADSVPILDARFFVTAVLTQRESGGNLAGVLDNLSAVIRERFKVKRQVKVVSAHGRMTAMVLMALPPTVGVAQLAIAPANAQLLLHDPLGIRMLIGAVVFQIAGMLVIKKIISIEY